MKCAVLASLLVLAAHPGFAVEQADADADFFFDDWEAQAAAVSDGELRVLDAAPDKRALRTTNRLTVTDDSVRTGWVELYQCQGDLDALPSVEITYRYQTVRDLRVVSTRHIGGARVEDQTVQLDDVADGAEVCVRAAVQVLKATASGGFEIRSGPFYRRFLDGYYPVHLDYRLVYPPDLLHLEGLDPGAAQGFAVAGEPGEVHLSGWFEGKLALRVTFSRR